jgi:hypothetical protein
MIQFIANVPEFYKYLLNNIFRLLPVPEYAKGKAV